MKQSTKETLRDLIDYTIIYSIAAVGMTSAYIVWNMGA